MTTPSYIPTYDTERATINEHIHNVFVFKTNIIAPYDVGKITSILASEFRISKWTVDLHDIDKVLRIESQLLTPQEIQKMIAQAGYQCEELPD
jgi:hypothetical protein